MHNHLVTSSSLHDYVHFSYKSYQHYMFTYPIYDGTTSGTSDFIRVGDGSIDLVQSIIDGRGLFC